MHISSIFGARRLHATTWTELLEIATTPDEILVLVRDFLATWSPDELAGLPAECRPRARFLVPEEVVLYAYTLALARCEATSNNPELLRMDRFFSEASRRMAMAMSAKEPDTTANA